MSAIMQFPTRSLAAINAKRRGIKAFECKKYGSGDGHYWEYEIRKDGSVLDYALLWAVGLDFVHHIEMPTVHTYAIAVITCLPDEVPTENKDELIQFEPITTSMLDPDSNRRKRTARERLEEEGRLPPDRDPVASVSYVPGYDAPLVHPITGMPL